MTETEQAEAALRMALALPDVAAMIAKDARENSSRSSASARCLPARYRASNATWSSPLCLIAMERTLCPVKSFST
jgi:hypothetical protein